MKWSRFLVFILIVFSLSSFSYSVGIYDSDGVFRYYVANVNPEIEINLSAGSYSFNVEDAVLYVDGTEVKRYDIEDSKKSLSLFTTKTYNFVVDEDISLNDNVKFKLNVVNSANSVVRPSGDPLEFYFKYDDVKPKMVDFVDAVMNEDKMYFYFDEPVAYVKLDFEGDVFYQSNIENYRVVSSGKVAVDLAGYDFEKEKYEVEYEYADLAGNVVSGVETVYVQEIDYQIYLMTISDDSSLVYNYDSRFPELFGNKIYTKSDDFTLKIVTNKESNCYFSSGILEFREFDAVNNKEMFETTNYYEHAFKIDRLDEKIWVACQNRYIDDDVVYLNDFMNASGKIINIVKYSGEGVDIVYSEPKSLVTNVPFGIFATTDVEAGCLYKVDSSEFSKFDSADHLVHKVDDVSLDNGNHKIVFECYDVMGNSDTVTNNIEIDPEKGIKVTDYEPKYTKESSTKVDISLSEDDGISCGYSLFERVSKTKFNSLNNISGTLTARSFYVQGLAEGSNSVYVYCKKDAEITETELEIVYDTKGVQFLNFTFVNGEYESNYVGSYDEISFKFESNSLVPVESYVVEVVYGNRSESFDFDSSSDTIRGDFEGATKLVFTGINEIGFNSTFEVSVRFDMTEPMISLVDDFGKKKIICTDIESGCAEVFYGFSQTSLDCVADKAYVNGSVEVGESNYICVDAFNRVGLKKSTVQLLDINSFNDTEPIVDDSSGGGDFIDDYDDSNSDNYDDTSEYDDDYDDSDDSSGSNIDDGFGDGYDDVGTGGNDWTMYLWIGGILFIVLLIVGLGYYAYRNGYLDKEIEKLGLSKYGLKRNMSGSSLRSKGAVQSRSGSGNSGSSGSSGNVSRQVVNNSSSGNVSSGSGVETYDDVKRPIVSQTNQIEKAAKHETHWDKLNKFVDDKMGSSKDSFDKFDVGSSGGIGRRAVGGKKGAEVASGNLKSLDKNSEEYDEFYTSVVGGDADSKLKQNVKNEADKFEDYLSKKESGGSGSKEGKK